MYFKIVHIDHQPITNFTEFTGVYYLGQKQTKTVGLATQKLDVVHRAKFGDFGARNAIMALRRRKRMYWADAWKVFLTAAEGYMIDTANYSHYGKDGKDQSFERIKIAHQATQSYNVNHWTYALAFVRHMDDCRMMIPPFTGHKYYDLLNESYDGLLELATLELQHSRGTLPELDHYARLMPTSMKNELRGIGAPVKMAI